MAKREREASDIGAMLGRMGNALVKRAEAGDVDALSVLVAASSLLNAQAGEAADALRAEPWGYSWADIGRELGVTRQAAQQRFAQSSTPGPPTREA